jgi:uncharacterized protein YukE
MVDVRMNYSSMEKMEKEFKGAAKQLDDSKREMQKVAKMMEDGSLQGVGGDAFRDAIQGKLIPVMKRLEEKMRELSGDINGAVVATRDGVSTAKSRFK